MLIGPSGTNFSEVLIEIHIFPLKKMHLKMSSRKWRPFYIGLNVLLHGLLVIQSMSVQWMCPNWAAYITSSWYIQWLLQWRHNGRDSVLNHQPHDCLLNRLFRRRSKKTSKLRVTGFVRGIHRGPVNSTHKWPVTRKMFPFDDVIIVNVVNWSCFYCSESRTKGRRQGRLDSDVKL